MFSSFRRTFVWAGFCLSALLFLPQAAFAQADKGTLLGTIQDGSGAPAAEVAVKVTAVSTNQARETKTNDAGNYSVQLGAKISILKISL